MTVFIHLHTVGFKSTAAMLDISRHFPALFQLQRVGGQLVGTDHLRRIECDF